MLYLVLINVALFVGCYVAGCLPISFKIPLSKVRILTVFSAGVAAIYHSHSYHHGIRDGNDQNHQNSPGSRKLTAADSVALANANLPLPVNNIDQHENNNNSNIHQRVGIALLLGYLFMLLIDQMSYTILELTCSQRILFGLRKLCRSVMYIPLIDKTSLVTGTNTSSNVGKSTANTAAATATTTTTSNLTNDTINNHSTIGSTQSSNHKGFVVTCGLVIHSLADGLAVGSAFALNQIQLEIILFLAIILHKIPAAFGLSCFLLHEGFPRNRIRLHMIAFSLASPLAAFFTYFYLSLSSQSSVENDMAIASTRTGFALLLSGGTFLYVAATHILPELINSSGHGSSFGSPNHHHLHDDSNMNIGKQSRVSNLSVSESEDPSGCLSSNYALFTVDSSHESVIMYNHPKTNEYLNTISAVHRLSFVEIIVLTVGTVIPIILSAGHSH
ncbi:unnamed protein product [Heterobilharzia americana]|nr:unnamed protein product [Heterobilharzia americana]